MLQEGQCDALGGLYIKPNYIGIWITCRAEFNLETAWFYLKCLRIKEKLVILIL